MNLKHIIQKHFITGVSILFLVVFAVFLKINAAPPDTKYYPGETLNPSCAPGDENCSVSFNFAPLDESDQVPMTNLKVGVPDGLATLDGIGKIFASQLPAIAISNTYVVVSQETMLVLDANVGDVVIRTDTEKTYILSTTPASDFSNWIELLFPTSPISSFNGRTGPVSPDLNDYTTSMVAEVSNLYYTNTRAIAAPLTGYASSSGIITSDDSILSAIQKLNGNNVNSSGWGLLGNAGTTASTATIGTTVDNNFIGTTDAKDFVFASNNLERMRITSGGNVGIGTTTPTYQLQTTGTVGVGGGLWLINDGVRTGLRAHTNFTTQMLTSTGALGILGVDVLDANVFRNNATLTIDFNANDISPTSFFRVRKGVYGGTPVEHFRITNAGNVGIGTTDPVGNLHISDGNSVNTSLITTDFAIISAQNTSPGFSIVSASSLSSGNRAVFKGVRARGTLSSPLVPNTNDDVLTFLGSIYDGVDTEGTAGVFFKVDGNVSSDVAPQRISFTTSETTANNRIERLVIKSNGKVGIGTTNPGALLSLGGVSQSIDGRLLIQAGDGSEWFSVGVGVSGRIQFNAQGGFTNAGGIDLGARFNIQSVNDTRPVLAVRGVVDGVSDIIRVSSPSVTTGNLFIIKSTGNVGIGTTEPNANAILDLTSTTKAFMPPRMTQAERNVISVPTAGMVIYQTDATPGLRTYNGTNWMRYTETTD